MKYFGELILLTLMSTSLQATILTPDLGDQKTIGEPNNNFIDPRVDYSKFVGRVTDKDDTSRILKVKVQNNNSKFLKAGDIVFFKVNNHADKDFCRASVRSIEDFYFSMYVQDFEACWGQNKYFPRGTQLNFKSELLATRVLEGSEYRKLLVLRKEGFLEQLNQINSFLWTFDQQKLKTAIEYDQRINELLREKQLALDNLIGKKQESLRLQTELVSKLDTLDESLNHYKVERQEYLIDRWNMDHDSDLPVGRRPQKLKQR